MLCHEMESSETGPSDLNSELNSIDEVLPVTPELSAAPGEGNYLLNVSRGLHFSRAAVVGLLAGLTIVAFTLSFHFVESERSLLLNSMHQFPSWGWAVLPVVGALAGALAGYLVEHYSPTAGGGGIAYVRAVLADRRELRWKKVLPVKFIGGVLALGAMSVGNEGPSVHLAACAGEGFADSMKLDKRSKKNLMASAAGAGLAAAFNAPLAGFIFTIEELQRDLSSITLVSALIASVASVAVSRVLTGQFPSFHIKDYPLPPLTALPLFAVMGIFAGYAGVIYNRTLIWSIKASRRTGLAIWKKGAIAGAITGIAAWWIPNAIGSGHQFAESILRGDYVAGNFVSFLVIILIGKFVLTMIGYSSGVPAGLFAPLLVLGAIIGQLFGHVSALMFPSVGTTPAAYAVVGMAAMFTSIVRAPLTGIVLILEMTGNQEQLFALCIACLMAYLIAEHARCEPIYDSLLDLELQKDQPK